MLAQMAVSGIALGAIYGLVALGIVLVYRATGVINFAHGEGVMISAFIAWTLLEAGIPYWLAAILTIAAAALIGLAIEVVLIGRFIGKPLLANAIATLGLYLILGDVAVWIWGKDPHDMAGPFSQAPILIGGVAVSLADLGIIATCLVLSAALFAFFRYARTGIAMQAAMSNETAARLQGVPVARMHGLAWMLSYMVGAVAGLLIAPLTFLHFTMMQQALHFAFAAAVLGGLTSMPGALVGGAIVGLTANLTGAYVDSAFKEFMPFLVMLAILIVKPSGLLGRHATKKI